MTDDLRVGRWFTIPGTELEWRFSTSGGPGGQHANKAATRAELSWDIAASGAVGDADRERLGERLTNRISDGVISVTVDDTRSQWRNRAIARKRLAALLEDALAPTKQRTPTKPHRAARQRRLEAKRRRAETKRLRKRPDRE